MPTTLLVDTDVFSYLWQERPEAETFRPVVEGAILVLSFTTVGEVWYGACKRRWGDRRMNELEQALRPYVVLPYSGKLARLWGQLKARQESVGQTLTGNDLWIAATGLHYDIPLVTNNRRHFERVSGLHLVPEDES